MLSDQRSRRQHREAGVSEHVVGDEGAQLAQHPPGPRAPPDIKNQRGALVDQVVGPPLPTRSAVGFPPRWEGGAAAGGGLVVDALELGQKGGEALLQQLHVVSLYFSGEERG